MPALLSEANWIILEGTTSVSTSGVIINSVDTLSDADGIALTTNFTESGVDSLRGQLILWTSGAANGDFGWIYRSDGSGKIFVTNDDPNTLPAIVATDTLDFISLDTTLNYDEPTSPTIENSTQLNIRDVNITDDTANGRTLFIVSTDKVEYRRIYWTIQRPQVGGFGRAHFWTNYIATKGNTNRGCFTARNEAFMQIERGTVIDCSINTSAADKRFLQFSAGAHISYQGMVVIRGIEDAKGIQSDGTEWSASGGIISHDTWRFETEGASPSNLFGFIFNKNGEGLGGQNQLPNIHGEVDTDFVVTAQKNAYIILGSTSSVVTNTVINAVSSDNGISASSFDADGTFIAGGDPATSGFGGGVTLDGAYDFGGPGVGRSIIADTGAVTITVPDTSNNSVLELVQNDVTNNPIGLSVVNTGIGNTSFFDTDGNGSSIVIDSEATTADVFSIDAPVTTSGNIISITDANSLTTGGIANFVSNSVDVSNRDLFVIHNDNPLADGTIVLTVRQDGARSAILVDQNADAYSIAFDSESTTSGVILVNGPITTTGNILNIPNADTLTTGMIANFASDSTDTGIRTLVGIVNENVLATAATLLELRQDAPNRAFFIDQNGNGESVVIDSQATSAVVMNFPAPTTTTGSVINISSANSLTSGLIMNLESDSASNAIRTLVSLINNNTVSTGTTAFRIQQDSILDALLIDKNSRGNAFSITANINNALDVIGIRSNVTNSGAGLAVSAAFEAGNVGIGTLAPTRPLHIIGDDNAIRLERISATAGFLLLQVDSGGRGELIAQNDLVLGEAGNQIEIDSATNVMNLGDPSGENLSTQISIDSDSGVISFLNAGQEVTRVAVADADHTLLISEYLIAYTSITATRTVDLPLASTATNQIFIVKDESGSASGANRITIDPNGAELIDGSATFQLTSGFESVSFYSNGTAWFII